MSGDVTAPSWVQSATPAEVVRQRQLGWTDFHPEDFCHVCGHRNPVWWTSLEVWSEVFEGHNGIVCPSCFTTLHEASTGDRCCWELSVSHRSGETVERAAADRLRSLAAIYEQPLNRDKTFTFTGRELAAMLKEEG